MRSITTSAVALGAALLLGLAGASPGFAKAHDQSAKNGGGFNTPPGVNAVGETAAAAQTLGENRGNSMNAPGQNKPDSRSNSKSDSSPSK